MGVIARGRELQTFSEMERKFSISFDSAAAFFTTGIFKLFYLADPVINIF